MGFWERLLGRKNEPENERIQFQDLEIKVVRQARRRRLSISVKPNLEIVVAARKTTTQNFLMHFIGEHESWVRKQLRVFKEVRSQFPETHFRDGELVPLLGDEVRLKMVASKAKRVQVVREENVLKVFVPNSFELLSDLDRKTAIKKILRKYYAKLAEEIISARVAFWSHEMGLIPNSIKYRDQKTMWGSCSSRGDLSLNWKLIVFEQRYIDYVVIHELAHLKHRDHSPSFWRLVEQFDRDAKRHQRYLGENQYRVDFISRHPELY